MRLAPGETFCTNSWCRKIYKQQGNDKFGYLCPNCDKKDVEETLKLCGIEDKQKKSTESKKLLILEKQRQIIVKAMKMNPNKLLSINDIINNVNRIGSFPRSKNANSTKPITDPIIRRVISKMIEEGLIDAVKIGRTYCQYKLNF
jgi:hypothetical protein